MQLSLAFIAVSLFRSNILYRPYDEVDTLPYYQLYSELGMDLIKRVHANNSLGNVLNIQLLEVMQVMRFSKVLSNPGAVQEEEFIELIHSTLKDIGMPVKVRK